MLYTVSTKATGVQASEEKFELATNPKHARYVSIKKQICKRDVQGEQMKMKKKCSCVCSL